MLLASVSARSAAALPLRPAASHISCSAAAAGTCPRLFSGAAVDAVPLHAMRLPSKEPAPHHVLVMHGLFGAGTNWKSLAQAMQRKHPWLSLHLLDLRNHGASPHAGSRAAAAMTADVMEYARTHVPNGRFSVLGHSMGGRVAMDTALRHPNEVRSLVVVDVSPRELSMHGWTSDYIQWMRAVPLASLRSHREADEALAKYIPEVPIRQFLLTNLKNDGDGGYYWRLNLEELERSLGVLVQFDPGQRRYPHSTIFIGGDRSNYITAGDTALILHHFPRALISMVSGAGHWVHSEKPKEVLELLAHHFDRVKREAN